jgi:stage II sporulation protein D
MMLSGSFAGAENTIRVLISDGKNFHLPSKDERVERLGNKKGDVLVSGLRCSGSIEVWKGDDGLYIVNELPLEEYVKGVVAGEVGKSWDMEALKAQAVVARTYALHQKMNSGENKLRYHLTSSVMSQVYKGGPVPEQIAKAVDATRGEILTFEGKPIIAYYHSTSGGMTEDPEEVFGKSYPYLKPVKTTCSLSPYYIWEKRIPLSEIGRAVKLNGIETISIDSYTVSGRVKAFRFVSGAGEKQVPAKDMRRDLGWERLPSTLITRIDRDGDDYIFEGKGYGHGVGMCQWTALDMAKEGQMYREILATFYPGTTLQLSSQLTKAGKN